MQDRIDLNKPQASVVTKKKAQMICLESIELANMA